MTATREQAESAPVKREDQEVNEFLPTKNSSSSKVGGVVDELEATTGAVTASASAATATASSTSPEKTKEKPKAFTIKYKRPRGSRACAVCRSRKVRCDAEIHIPCTNCITFGCECVLPEAKKRSNSDTTRTKRIKHGGGDYNTPISTSMSKSGSSSVAENGGDGGDGDLSGGGGANGSKNGGVTVTHSGVGGGGGGGSSTTTNSIHGRSTNSSSSANGPHSANETILNISQVLIPPSLTSNYKVRPGIHKREVLMGNTKPTVTFLGASSVGIVAQKVGEPHIRLTEDVYDIPDGSLDSVELEILKMRGAFLLPQHDLALDLIETYFERVHPLMPVINRSEFMRRFLDPKDSPSLMVLQAVLLCGARISKNPLVLDLKGSTNLACLTFFRRAKALYETSYELDPASTLQTLILIGSYWEGPEDVTKNSFYWTRVAVGLAQGFGFHRDVKNSPNLSTVDKKIWRRIWWCLFEKDRNVAIAFGRPSVIDLNDCDVPMLTMEDFNEDEPDYKLPYQVNETHALYFIHLVKLAEITGIILKHQYTVKSEQMKSKLKFSVIQHSDMLMGIWFTSLPPELSFSLTDPKTQNFYACLLNAQYYNRLYLIHRSNLLRMAKSNAANSSNYKYPSWGILFQAARMISIVSKILLERDQIRYCPVMFVYILFLALVMLIYHVDSENNVIATAASDSLYVLRSVLRELAKYWPVAELLRKLFDKYANDKIKRAKVIEKGTKMAYYEDAAAQRELLARSRTVNFQGTTSTSLNDLYLHAVERKQQFNQYQPQQQQQEQQQQQQQQYQQNLQRSQFQDHLPSNSNGGSGGSVGTIGGVNLQSISPNLNISDISAADTRHKGQGQEQGHSTKIDSTYSFPDISLVTESIDKDNQHNFLENFDPTQLFPDVKFSLPPTRAQSPEPFARMSPTTEVSGEEHSEATPNVAHEGQAMAGLPSIGQTPQEIAQTNFIDDSFLNMNLQKMDEGLGSFFSYLM